MGARKISTRDLATDQAIDERITALRDLLRARRHLDEAKASRMPARAGAATKTMETALNRASLTRSALEAALQLEAEARA